MDSAEAQGGTMVRMDQLRARAFHLDMARQTGWPQAAARRKALRKESRWGWLAGSLPRSRMSAAIMATALPTSLRKTTYWPALVSTRHRIHELEVHSAGA